MITENLSTLKIYKLTQEQYERKLANGEIDLSALYFTDDEDADIDMSMYATTEQLKEKADIEHTHNDIYYTEAEMDEKIAEINESITTHSHSISNITNLQNALDEKQDSINGAASTITSSNLVVGKVLVSNNLGKVDVSGVTRLELDYLCGVKSGIQLQFDNLNEGISASTNEAKQYAANGDKSTLESSKNYTDDAITQKTQVQIITWGADD